MDEYDILKRELAIPDDFIPILNALLSPEEKQIIVLIAKEFLSAPLIARKLGEADSTRVSSHLEMLYHNGFLEKRFVDRTETYRSKSFYGIVHELLEEARYEVGALGFENLQLLRQYYLSTRIQITDEALDSGQLKYSSKVIPVRKSIPVQQHILPRNQAIKLLEEAELLALTTCGCRSAFNNCGKRLDVCLIMDKEAEYYISREQATKITLSKAKNILEIADEAGLVHLTLYLPGQKAYAICSCCSCCCHELQALIKLGKKKYVAKSDYIANYDPESCNGCGTCLERCVFNARVVREEKIVVIEENCYGCGLCITGCPTEAVKLVLRNKTLPMY
ncbi:MAG: 4Fe-4S binding protein [Candidatus Odinarchaeota archaeon]